MESVYNSTGDPITVCIDIVDFLRNARERVVDPDYREEYLPLEPRLPAVSSDAESLSSLTSLDPESEMEPVHAESDAAYPAQLPPDPPTGEAINSGSRKARRRKASRRKGSGPRKCGTVDPRKIRPLPSIPPTERACIQLHNTSDIGVFPEPVDNDPSFAHTPVSSSDSVRPSSSIRTDSYTVATAPSEIHPSIPAAVHDEVPSDISGGKRKNRRKRTDEQKKRHHAKHKANRRERRKAEDKLRGGLKSISLKRKREEEPILLPEFDVHTLPAARGAWLGRRQWFERTRRTLANIREAGLRIIEWEGHQTHPIIDKLRRCFILLSAPPRDETWPALCKRMQELIEEAEGDILFKEDHLNHLRGPFPAMTIGVSHGGGREVSFMFPVLCYCHSQTFF